MISFDPIRTLGIGGFGRHKYWLIGAWSESKSPSNDFLGFITLKLEGLGSTTWGALVLMIICEPTPGSNVISPMSSITILGRMMSGSIWMSKMLFSVCCRFDSKMMIQTNDVFALIRGFTSMELIDCMECLDLGPIEHV